jgi:predicted MFS family arabinose efflux permease
MSSVLMLGPLLVELAGEFHTSVAVAGQLAGATSIAWGITGPLIGPISDSYGRPLVLFTGVMLLGVGFLGSVVAWNYGSLLGFRLLTGVAAAMVSPTSIAAVADIFPPEGRGKAIDWIMTASGISAAIGVAMVALLLDVGGWRLPFLVFGSMTFVLWRYCGFGSPKARSNLASRCRSSSITWKSGPTHGLVRADRQRAVANGVSRRL